MTGALCSQTQEQLAAWRAEAGPADLPLSVGAHFLITGPWGGDVFGRGRLKANQDELMFGERIRKYACCFAGSN